MYHVPPGSHPDYPAIDVLVAGARDTPRRAPAPRAGARPAWRAAACGGERSLREPGYAYFGASLRKDVSLEPARDGADRVARGLGREPVTDDEVERARTQLLNDIEHGSSTIRASCGIALSEFIAMGDWRLFFLYRDRPAQGDARRTCSASRRSTSKPATARSACSCRRRKPGPRRDSAGARRRSAGSGTTKATTAVAAGETFDPSPQPTSTRAPSCGSCPTA